MSSLQTILNPQNGQSMSIRSGSEPSPSPPPQDDGLPEQDRVDHTIDPSRLAGPLQAHSPHPDCPDRLGCLADTTARPQHTLPVILRCAILGSPNKRLTIREIYAEMEGKYSYYKSAGTTWKQSVRHHLSLNRLFERVPRPVTEPGFGSYWTVNLEAPPGTKRPRKRGRPNKGGATGPDGPDVSALDPNAMEDQTDSRTDDPAPVRKRSRVGLEEPSTSFTNSGWSGPSDSSSVNRQGSAFRSTPIQFEDGDDDEERNTRMSEDDDYLHRRRYDQIEPNPNTPYHLQRDRPPLSSSSPYATYAQPIPPLLRRPSYSQAATNERPPQDNLINLLQNEVEGLRQRASADREASHQMQNQVASAEAEIFRLKANLQSAEARADEEGRKRRELERALDDESRSRRTAELELSNLKTQLSRQAST